jgi:hypothetical protein
MRIEIDLTSLEDFKLNLSDNGEGEHVTNFESSDLLLYLLAIQKYKTTVEKRSITLKIGKSTNLYCNSCFGLYVIRRQEQESTIDLFLFWETFDLIKSKLELFKL